MKLAIIFAVLISSALAAEVKEKVDSASPSQNKDKRQIHGQYVPGHYQLYRATRKQERITPVQESQEEDDGSQHADDRADTEEYRPGQVISVHPQELLDLQPERKAPVSNERQLQPLYGNDLPEHRQNLQALSEMYSNPAPSKVQEFFYYDPQASGQFSIQPSRTVIARPSSLSNGGEASVGAALSVSDSGASSSETNLDRELFALLGQNAARPEEPQQSYSSSSQTYNQAPQVYSPAPIQTYTPEPQTYSQAPQTYSQAPQTYSQAPQTFTPAPQTQQVSPQSVASQYQQIDRYITKPTKKPTKLRPKVQYTQAQALSSAPQQYLIETTNVAQQQPHVQPQPQLQQQPQPQQQQYRYVQQVQQPRPAQAFRYVHVPTQQPSLYYERQENEGLKVVAAPKLQQQRQFAYRLVPQYQPEAAPKEFRVLAPRPQQVREQVRVPTTNVDRPVSYLKSYVHPEKMRSVKIIDQPAPVPNGRQPHYIGEQYYLRPVYRDQQPRYEVLQHNNQEHYTEQQKQPPVVYFNKNIAPKKVLPHYQHQIPREQPEQSVRVEQPTRLEHVNVEQHGQSLEEQRAQLPPPKNNKAYTPQEFAALVAAGYSVTPVPVNSLGSPQQAQSRSSPEPAQPIHLKRRPSANRRHQYLPLRSDDAP